MECGEEEEFLQLEEKSLSDKEDVAPYEEIETEETTKKGDIS